MRDTAWSGEAKYKALLSVAEAANSCLALSGVLDAVARALDVLVPIDVIGVLTREGELIGGYLGNHLRSDRERAEEPTDAFIRRMSEVRKAAGGASSYLVDLLEGDLRTIVFNDVKNDASASRALPPGTECAVMAPLTVRGALVAGIGFARVKPLPFAPQEVAILEDVARPVAWAVANALAFEEIQRLRSRLEDENFTLKEEIAASAAAGGMIGASSGLRAVQERVRLVAATDSTVLITGETGTGKELVARAIHSGSPRSKRALVKVNCAALPEGLVASELFGHEKGAFTGAFERRRGRFELATGGTLFLDEVGDLLPAVQVALLRVLQEGEFERVGGSDTLRTDARVIAATNRSLEDAVHDGKFRSDLLFRLNVFPIRVPPLRERTEDIPLIAEYYASQHARKLGKTIRGIARTAMDALIEHPWPGNIRELENAVERAVILARRPLLDVADFELPILGARSQASAARRAAPDAERGSIEEALATCQGRVSGAEGAAEALGIPPSTLESRIRRLGIDKHAFRRGGRTG